MKFSLPKIEQRKAFFLILLSNILWAFCYPPFPLGFLSFVILVPAFLATTRLNSKQAFLYNFTGGIAYNLVMYWWIYNVMKVGPALVIFMGLILLILFLSLFNACLGWLFRQCLNFRFGLCLYPFLWTGLEVLRAKGEMSFPWNNFGYTLGHYLIFLQSAAWVGAIGISFLLVCTNLFIYSAWTNKKKRAGKITLALSIPTFMLILGGIRLATPVPTQPSMDISMVQPSIPQIKKWNEGYFQEVMQKTWNTMDGHFGDTVTGSELILLPETAIPDFIKTRPDIFLECKRRAAAYHAPILAGALDYTDSHLPERPYYFYNSAFLFSPDSNTETQQYSKLRLVPFSERLPFDDIFPLLNYVNLGEGDFCPGKDYALWGNEKAYSPSICYEIIYSDYVREAKRHGAKLLVNITNDGWFGLSNAPYQHANISRFRGVESGLPLARCANSGISLFYDAQGRILGKTKLFEQRVLRRKLPLTTYNTLYQKIGAQVENLFMALFLVGFFALIIKAFVNRKKKQP